MSSGVYWFYQPSRDRCLYVGSSSHVERRKQEHLGMFAHGKHRNPHLQNVYNKYGAADVVFMLLETCPTEHLIEREQFWMGVLAPSCNVAVAAPNATLGRKHTAESKEKMRIAKEGKKLTEEHKRKIGASNIGRVVSVETRSKLRAAFSGRVFSAETLSKMGAASAGHITSTKTRRKIAEGVHRAAEERHAQAAQVAELRGEKTERARSDAQEQNRLIGASQPPPVVVARASTPLGATDAKPMHVEVVNPEPLAVVVKKPTEPKE